MLDKLIDGVNRSVTAVANKSEEYVEIARLKTQISACAKSKDAKKAQLGAFVYEMFGSGSYDSEAVNAFCGEIHAIDDEIAALENKIAEVQNASGRAAGDAPSRVCPSCGGPTPPAAKFCTGCGAPLPPPGTGGVTCSCGLLNKPDAKFCRACGNPL
jgi:membrane protease subunit (stomatin/prohibitin family)